MRKIKDIRVSNSSLYWREYPELREVILTVRWMLISELFIKAIPVGVVRGLFTNKILYFQFMNEDTKELFPADVSRRITDFLNKEFEIEENESKARKVS